MPQVVETDRATKAGVAQGMLVLPTRDFASVETLALGPWKDRARAGVGGTVLALAGTQIPK